MHPRAASLVIGIETVILMFGIIRWQAVKEIGPNESTYVFGPEEQQRLNRLLGKYVGSPNFHNFTVQARAPGPVLSAMARLPPPRHTPIHLNLHPGARRGCPLP